MLRRIASRMSGCTGRVFVFCDIQATSRRCSWANSKLSFDDMDGDLGFRMCEDFTGHIACGRLVPARHSILILPRVAKGQKYVRPTWSCCPPERVDGPTSCSTQGISPESALPLS